MSLDLFLWHFLCITTHQLSRRVKWEPASRFTLVLMLRVTHCFNIADQLASIYGNTFERLELRVKMQNQWLALQPQIFWSVAFADYALSSFSWQDILCLLKDLKTLKLSFHMLIHLTIVKPKSFSSHFTLSALFHYIFWVSHSRLVLNSSSVPSCLADFGSKTLTKKNFSHFSCWEFKRPI